MWNLIYKCMYKLYFYCIGKCLINAFICMGKLSNIKVGCFLVKKIKRHLY